MKTHDTTPPISESGAEVAQMKQAAISSASKFSPAYWRERVFRKAYEHEGAQFEVAEFRARIQHAGKREEIALGTNDREAAARTAAKLFSRVKAAGWAIALAEFAPDRTKAKGVPTTVGDVIEAASRTQGVGANTLRGYVVCFRKLAAEAYGVRATASRFDYRNGGLTAWRKRVDSIRLDKLTPKRIQNVLDRRIASAKGNPIQERRSRTTAVSVLRQAKALFAPGRKLPFENLPDPFAGVSIEAGTPARYVSTVNAGELLREAKQNLSKANGEAYKAFLLALGAGLRAAEIDNLQWQHVDSKNNTVRVMTTNTFGTKTASSEREVFVDPGLIAELERYRRKATALYVLESERQPKPNSPVASYRAETTFESLKKWLRAHGVTAHKPIHTLRKEFGSLVTENSDIFTASRQLGHASIALSRQTASGCRRVPTCKPNRSLWR